MVSVSPVLPSQSSHPFTGCTSHLPEWKARYQPACLPHTACFIYIQKMFHSDNCFIPPGLSPNKSVPPLVGLPSPSRLSLLLPSLPVSSPLPSFIHFMQSSCHPTHLSVYLTAHPSFFYASKCSLNHPHICPSVFPSTHLLALWTFPRRRSHPEGPYLSFQDGKAS